MNYQVIRKLLPHVDLDNIKQRETIFRDNRYHVMYGGRGGGKSIMVAKTLVIEGFLKPRRILCTREIQKSISDSVMQGLWDAIEDLGLDGFYTRTKTEITGVNGTRFMFYGLRTNVTNIKSISGIDFVWAEEAEAITEESWQVLLPSIRAEGSRVIITFNPKSVLDNTYQRFVLTPPADSIVTKINWSDNPFFPDVLEKERLDCLETYPDMYPHIWEGEPLADSDLAIIQPSWIRAAMDAHIKLGIQPEGHKMVGFDVADEGPDSNAAALRHGWVVTDLHEWKDSDPNSAALYTWNWCLERGGSHIIYDNIGVGAGAKGSLREEERKMIAVGQHDRVPVISGFNAAATVHNPKGYYIDGKTNAEMFHNLKAQSWWMLRDRFYNTWRALEGKPYDVEKLISIDSTLKGADVLAAELSQPRREFLNGKFRVESKDSMKKRGVKSPNLADALVMAFSPIADSGYSLSAW